MNNIRNARLPADLFTNNRFHRLAQRALPCSPLPSRSHQSASQVLSDDAHAILGHDDGIDHRAWGQSWLVSLERHDTIGSRAGAQGVAFSITAGSAVCGPLPR